MDKQKYAVLIEVASIQQYIFSSNKLKENIGASYIIEKLLFLENGVMDTILKTKYSSKFNLNHWRTDVNDIDITSDCFIGYIGGGNALVFFSNETNAHNFIKKFSITCLTEFPSLRIGFGVKKDFNLSKYKDEYQLLLQDLKERKAKYISVVSISKHGITADCPWSNDAAEVFEVKSKSYISSASGSKLKAAKISQDNQAEIYKCLKERYILTDEIDLLGQNKEASYIAVVHIDGNGMGKIFSNITNLVDLRKKSIAVSDKANNAMTAIIQHLIEIKTAGKLSDLSFKDEGILPIRPILVGGDDVTFICEGRLGIYLAEKFIEFFYDENERIKDKDSPDKLMDGACAGVAIVKSHFPFYKAVKLAEELCSEAKKASRIISGSYISYYYSATTFSGSLEELRGKTHVSSSGITYFGPYKLFEATNIHSIEMLKSGIKHFRKKWPKNKIMHLRDIIADSDSSQKLFEKELSELELAFPTGTTAVWDSGQTAFFDQIELFDFYLETLL